jgi:hypothetical protein
VPQTAQPNGGFRGRTTGIAVSPDQVESLAMTGAAWDDVVDAADNSITASQVAGDKNANTDVYAFAKSLCVVADPGEADFATYTNEILAGITHGITFSAGHYNWLNPGSEPSPELALARNITSWVLAADMIGLPSLNATLNGQFRAFLAGPVRTTVLGNRTLISTHEDRPNNFGTHAGAARLAIAAYIGDDQDWARCVKVFRGWLGDRSAYAEFDYGTLSWQFDENDPVGINRVGATKPVGGEERDIDGVLPDDQRRNGDFQWPPPRTAYVYEALQGAVLQAIIIHHASRGIMGPALNPFSWNDKALLRAYLWLNDPDRGNFIVNGVYEPVEGWDTGPETDDYWQIAAVKKRYGSDASALPTIASGHEIGKAFGFAHWFAGASTWLVD